MHKVLTEVMMICVLGVGLASANTAGQPQPAPTAQSQVAQQETNGPAKDGLSGKEAKKQAKLAKKQAEQARKRAREEADATNASAKSDCSSKDAEGDPEAPQNKVEYGGGG